MDYEKAYKEALERARKYWESQRTCFDINALTEIFPELRESEDEKIRKMLIEFFGRGLEYNSSTNGVLDKDIVRWLEKQGKRDARYEDLEELLEADTIYQMAMNDAMVNEAKEKAAKSLSKLCIGKLLGFEKKGEQNHSEQDLEIVVVPKFKVGDLVVDNCGYVWKIEGILNQFYILEGVEGGESRPTIERVDKTFHLWTIQDAKDGDVLACGDKVTDCPFIFHNLTKELNPRSYCGVNTLCHFQDNDENGGFWCHSEEVRPATKEQRDLLFQKMKEAGYTFDFEKKELKKIEQKPAAWSKDYTERMGQIINYLTCQAKEEPTRKRTLLGWVSLLKSIFRKGLPEIQIPGTEAARKGIHRIMDVLDWAADKGRISDSDCEDYMILLSAYLPQPKPVWNEEDTFKVQRICKYLDEAKKYYADITEVRDCIDWLKHIEQRMGG